MRAKRSSILVGAIALLAALAVSVPASAASTTRWASWQPLTGTAGAFATSVQLTPDATMIATVTSDSRAGQVGVVPGASAWLSEGTPVGAKYGSSRDQPYLNLRAKADTPTGSSTTTYAFQNPTPAGGWTFVLGDIDADAVRIEAVGPDGQALTAEQLGFRGGFNYCAPGTAGKPSCTGAADDVPIWDAETLTLTGNAAAADTAGAAAWFEPAAPIISLTFVFTRRAGLPVYQTWFASLARDISGTVRTPDSAPQDGATLVLRDVNGRVVASTMTGPDGTYSFPQVLASDDYTVQVTAPDGLIAEGSATRQVDLGEADAVGVDFVVRPIVPVAVSGRVVDGNENGVSGVTVRIDGTPLTAITGSDGGYLFDTVPEGPRTVVVVPPNGYSTVSDEREITIPGDSEIPIDIAEDFVLLENADIGGTVTSPANGLGVAGAVVTVTDAEGAVVATAVSRPLGEYTVPRLPAGVYTVTITPPNGYAELGPISARVDLAADDLTDVNFELALLGSFAGTVRDEAGAPVGGVVLTLDGPDGTQQLVSDVDGTYSLGGLAPGDYVLTVVPPEGTEAVEFAQRVFGFPPQGGGTFTAQDFTLAAIDVEPTNPPVSPGPADPGPQAPGTGGGSGAAGTGDVLPGTGLGPETFAWAAGGALVLIVGAMLLVVSRRRAATRDDD